MKKIDCDVTMLRQFLGRLDGLKVTLPDTDDAITVSYTDECTTFIWHDEYTEVNTFLMFTFVDHLDGEKPIIFTAFCTAHCVEFMSYHIDATQLAAECGIKVVDVTVEGITVDKPKLYCLAKECTSAWFSDLRPKMSECVFTKITPFYYELWCAGWKVELQFLNGEYVLRWYDERIGQGDEAYLADFAVADFGIAKFKA